MKKFFIIMLIFVFCSLVRCFTLVVNAEIDYNNNYVSQRKIQCTYNDFFSFGSSSIIKFTVPNSKSYTYTYTHTNIIICSVDIQKNDIYIEIIIPENGYSELSLNINLQYDNGNDYNSKTKIYMYTGELGTVLTNVSFEEAYKMYIIYETPSYFTNSYDFNNSLNKGITTEDYIVANSTNNISFVGTINWLDNANNLQKLCNAKVEIWNTINGMSYALLGSTYTDSLGNYSYTISDNIELSCYNIGIIVYASNQNVKVSQTEMSDEYCVNHPNISNNITCGNTVTKSFYISNNTACERSFQVFQAANMASNYVYAMENEYLDQLTIIYPDSNGTKYKSQTNIVSICSDDYSDWDVIQHEYGHFARYKLTNLVPAGGIHLITRNMYDYPFEEKWIADPSDKSEYKFVITNLCWSEAVASYFSYAVQDYFNAKSLQIPFVGDNYYDDVDYEGSHEIKFNLETAYEECEEVYTFFGECGEGSILAVLFDLLDDVTEGYDNLQFSHYYIWNIVFNNTDVVTMSDFCYQFYNQSNINVLHFGRLLQIYGFSSNKLSTSTLNITNTPTLYWSSGGGSSQYYNDIFDLKFYDFVSCDLLFEVNDLYINQYSLTESQWNIILGNGSSVVYWAVVAKNSIQPSGVGFISGNCSLIIPLANNVSLDTNSLYGLDSSSCVWFKFIAPETATYVFETTGSIDTLGALFNNLVTGLSFDGMITNAYDDDSGIDNNFKISYMLSKNQIVYIRVTGKTSSSSGEFGFSVTSNDHIHSYTASYMYSSISTHLAYCNCGDFIYEPHNYVLHNYGKKCSKCLHISSGFIPVNPVNLIFNQNEIDEIKENSEN